MNNRNRHCTGTAMLINGLYRKLNEMQFEFGVVTQSPAVEDLEE